MPQGECASTSSKYSYNQLNELDRALGSLSRLGISELSSPYQELYKMRAKILKGLGLTVPRNVTPLIRLLGFSPGEFTLWHDAESGFMVEARARPGAPPVYHYVSDEVAAAVIKKELTPELEKELLTPDTYVGE